MGYIIVILLSIGYFFIFPNVAWDVKATDLFELTDTTTNSAKFEDFLKRYNLIDTTTAEFAAELIEKMFIFTLIFLIMGCIIVHVKRKNQRVKQEKDKYKNSLESEKSKIIDQKEAELKDVKQNYEMKLKEKDVEIAYLRSENLLALNANKSKTTQKESKNKPKQTKKVSKTPKTNKQNDKPIENSNENKIENAETE